MNRLFPFPQLNIVHQHTNIRVISQTKTSKPPHQQSSNFSVLISNKSTSLPPLSLEPVPVGFWPLWFLLKQLLSRSAMTSKVQKPVISSQYLFRCISSLQHSCSLHPSWCTSVQAYRLCSLSPPIFSLASPYSTQRFFFLLNIGVSQSSVLRRLYYHLHSRWLQVTSPVISNLLVNSRLLYSVPTQGLPWDIC